MSGFTVDEAREEVLALLDDEDGRRPAPTNTDGETDWTKVDRALRKSLDTCLDEYASEGGDRFDEEVSVSSDTEGLVELATYDIRDIRAVLLDVGDSNFYPLEAADRTARGPIDTEARDLKLIIIRAHRLIRNPDPADLLVGQEDGVARSWETFDQWVCAAAADKLGAKDAETRQAILREIDRCKGSVLPQKRVPQVLPWGAAANRVRHISIQNQLSWIWTARAQTMQLIYRSAR
jgi:hypothetical protein